MRARRKIRTLGWVGFTVVLWTVWACDLPASGTDRLPPRLVALAKKAKNPSGWAALRKYAASRLPPRDRAWAYFVLGYQEYTAKQYSKAEGDLTPAAAAEFPFADLAAYYLASAAYKNDHPNRTVDVLKRFPSRYPRSTVRDDAVELLAWAYIQTGSPADAIRVLTADPRARLKPALALLLGRAYQRTGNLLNAAAIDQEVYYAFPASSQAKAAAVSLDELKLKLGAQFPRVTDEIATARVDKLYSASRYQEAMAEYDQLLKDRRTSSLAWRWNLGRARCLLKLGRPDEAIESLLLTVPLSPEIDAERLEILAEAYIEKKDEEGMNRMLGQLQSHYSTSSQYARALFAVASYFMRKGDWDLSGVFYHTLAISFPDSSQGSEVSWRAAWMEYLQGKARDARAGFLQLIQRYPSSPHLPAALYFLGRLEEKEHHGDEARGFYKLLQAQFIHDYYALEASRRLKALGTVSSRLKGGKSSQQHIYIGEIARLIPPADPIAFDLCARPREDGPFGPFLKLAALGLNDLAAENVRDLLDSDPSSPELILLLSHLEARRGRTDRAIFFLKKLTPDYDRYTYTHLPRNIWEMLYPRSFWTLVRRYAQSNRLYPYFIMGLIRQESGFNPQATSPSDARGLMQILPQTASRHPSRWTARKLYEPSYNVRFGSAYLRQLLKRYKGNLVAALAAYNAGPSRVDDWLARYPSLAPEEFVEAIPYPGTRTYVKAIFRDAAMYRHLLTGSAEFKACRAPAPRARRPRR